MYFTVGHYAGCYFIANAIVPLQYVKVEAGRMAFLFKASDYSALCYGLILCYYPYTIWETFFNSPHSLNWPQTLEVESGGEGAWCLV